MTTDSILPGNLSELERDIDTALSRIAEIDIPISVLWDPWKCPIDALPYLAWAMSVDMWRSEWPEIVKRRVVANSLEVHKRKGTRPAVEQALRDLGVEAEFVEWFEAEPQLQRGTFDLIAWANENLTPGETGFLNQTLYDQLRAAVMNAKNVRSHFTFKVGAKFGPNSIGAAGAVTGLGALSRNDTNAVQQPLESVASVAAGLAGQGVSLTRQDGQLTIDAKPRPVSALVAGACRAWSVIYRRMETKT